MADIKYTDQGSAIDPDAVRYTDQGSAIDPDAVRYTDQGSAIDPDAVQYTDQGSAIDPDAVRYTDQGSAIDSDAAAPVQGTEGSLLIQNDGTAIKVYKSGFKCNTRVLSLVRQMSGKGYVADVLDYGTRDFGGRRCDFELMKYYPLGAASKYDLRGDAEAITRIVAKTAICLDACHRKGFIHKDVKPANILISDDSIWDCVLADFGFAAILEDGKVSTIQNRTPIYAAPEVYDPSNTAVIGGHTYCTLTPASDFYSLGMTALSLWNGEQALLAKEAELAIRKRNDLITVDKNIPEPLNRIIRGLLVKDPAHRWGLDEIRRTLLKEDVPVYAGGFEVIFNGTTHQVAHSVEELAELMKKDRKLATSYLYSGQVSRWLEKRPELKIEIDRIVEKDFPRDEITGFICALHILNPLYDLNLHTQNHPLYAMTGETIGRLLNDAYNIYYGRFGGERKRVISEWDDDCTKRISGSAILLRLVSSFESWSERSYLVWFLRHKGSRFADQLSWMKYCLDFDSRDNKKKAGPKDAAYLEQTAMMKTIAGFGHTPTYDHTDEPAGLRGYLAVKHHENPKADLSVKYSYEKLLKEYLDEYSTYCPDCREEHRFLQARNIAAHTASKAKKGAGSLKTRSLLQRIASILIAGVPAIYLMVRAISLVIDIPRVDVSGINFGWTFAIIGIIIGTVAAYMMDIDGCLFQIISGLVLGLILFVIVKLLGTFVFWIYAAIILAIVIIFAIKVLFVGKAGNVPEMKGDPGFMELTLEPLYYAFNDESSFKSSLSAYIDDDAISDFKSVLKSRRRTIMIFTGIFWALLAGQYYIDKLVRTSPPAGTAVTEITQAAAASGADATTEDAETTETAKSGIRKNKRKRGIIND